MRDRRLVNRAWTVRRDGTEPLDTRCECDSSAMLAAAVAEVVAADAAAAAAAATAVVTR